MFHPALQGSEHRLSSVIVFQAGQNHADVALHRGFRDSERRGDLLVAFSMDHQREHLALSGAQIRVGSAMRQAARDGWWEEANSSLHPAQRIDERIVRNALDN